MYYIYYDTHDLSIMGNGEDLIKNIQQSHKVPLIGGISAKQPSYYIYCDTQPFNYGNRSKDNARLT
jgi:hypothetical protein